MGSWDCPSKETCDAAIVNHTDGEPEEDDGLAEATPAVMTKKT